MAVPFCVLQVPLSWTPGAADVVTVKVMVVVLPVPSVTLTSLTATVGKGSLSRMVPTPWPSAMVALVGTER